MDSWAGRFFLLVTFVLASAVPEFSFAADSGKKEEAKIPRVLDAKAFCSNPSAVFPADTQKPAWIIFGASWCGPCRAQEDAINADFDRMSTHFNFVKLDASDWKALPTECVDLINRWVQSTDNRYRKGLPQS